MGLVAVTAACKDDMSYETTRGRGGGRTKLHDAGIISEIGGTAKLTAALLLKKRITAPMFVKPKPYRVTLQPKLHCNPGAAIVNHTWFNHLFTIFCAKIIRLLQLR